MTDKKDNDLNFGKPIDDDYIDVETRRADVSVSEEDAEDDNIQRDTRSAQHPDMSEQQFDMSHIFDVGGGNGASNETDELIDENAIIENDGRSDTRTFFYPSQAPERQQRKFKRLIRWQDGEGDSQRDVENRAADRRRAVETFCGHLDMTPYHRERVKHVMEGVNMSHMAHYSSEKVILAIISLVANEDNRFIRDEPTFRNLLNDVGSDLRELKRIRELVRRKSERL